MTKLDAQLYVGKEQTYVKHFVLANYLERLTYIAGPAYGTISYIDAFAGPWKNIDAGLQDTSPGIAVRVLGAAREALEKRGKSVRLRAMFIEENAASCRKLREKFAASPLEVQVHHGAFAGLVPECAAFARSGGSGFCFTFIDPCGWTGLPLNEIAPLLAIHPGEVLVNFMTGHIHRFVTKPDPRFAPQFESMFGSENFRDELVGLEGIAREEAIVDGYCNRLRATGNFQYVVSAVVLNPLKDRTHFHLVYATRSDKGLQVFRQTEHAALKEQADLRAGAQQRKREAKGQRELFGAEVMAKPYIEELRQRYLERAKEAVRAATPIGARVPFEQVAIAAMLVPTIRDQDVKDLLKAERKAGTVDFPGLSPRQVPQWGEQSIVVRFR